MSESVYEIFQKLTEVGMQASVYLMADGKLVEKKGTIREITNSGLLLQSPHEITFVSREAIQNFSVSNGEKISDAPSDTKPHRGADSSISVEVSKAEPSIQNSNLPKTEEALSAKRILDGRFASFFEPLILQAVQPNFAIDGLGRDDRADLIRWKNKYDYAIKVRELHRVVGDIKPIARLAERLRHPDIYLLAGATAMAVQNYDLAKPSLLSATALGSSGAAAALTWFAWHRMNDAETAFEMACRAIILNASAFGTLEHSATVLGRLLGKLADTDKLGIADAVGAFAGTPAELIANSIIAFALRDNYPDAASAAMAGDLLKARGLSENAKVFLPLAPLSVEVAERDIRPEVESKKSAAAVDEFGRITSVNPDKRFGFLTNEVTGETLFFAFGHVTGTQLQDDIESGVVGHKVYFVVQQVVKTPSARYDQARSIRLRPNQSGTLNRALPPVQARLHAGAKKEIQRAAPTWLPKGAGTYADAKRHEQLGNFEVAERLLPKAIEEGGRYRQSAIKDLAMLMGRRNRPMEGIELLDRYREEFDPKRPVDNLKASLLVKAGEYQKAASLFAQLYRTSPRGTRDGVGPAKQAGYCFSLLSNFEDALKFFEAARTLSPSDSSITEAIERVRRAKTIGILSADDTRQLQELAGLAVASGLSSFANFFMQMSDFKGADERSITRGFFEAGDFQKIDRQLRAIRGRQPRMKGQLYQTLAAMSVKAPLEAGDISVQDALRSCFFFMGEAAINDKLASDSVRCFLAEAAHIASRLDQVTDIARYLLNSYLSEPLSTEEFSTDTRRGAIHLPLQTVIRLFEGDEIGWKNLLSDLPYYAAVAEYSATLIVGEARRNPTLSQAFFSEQEIESLRQKEVERIQSELNILRPLVSQHVTGDGLQQISTTLNSSAASTRFKLDQVRLYELSKLASEASNYWREQDYIEREATYGRITGGLKALSDAVKKEPTKLTIEMVLPLADRLLGEILDDFDKFRTGASASLSLTNILQDDYYVPDIDGVITLALELISEKGSTPIEGLSLSVTSADDDLQQVEACYSPELLRGGGRREIQVKIRPSATRLAELAFTIQVSARYHNRAANKIEDTGFSLPIAIGASDSFAEINNPYAAYSGGAIVSDPRMLFGRSELLARIRKQVAEGPVGQCFVLYGQKRSGKSSVLYRLKELLTRPQLSVLVTVGTMDIYEAESSFVRQCIDAIEEQLKAEIPTLSIKLPTHEQIKASPLRTFQLFVREALAALAGAGWDAPKLVLLIDEFTYLFEYIQEKIIPQSFMRQWKALLELGLFSAVVVGQDSMPKFKQAFPNEFGVTHDERISYLSLPDAKDLAQRPIDTPNGNRYRGRAMEKLLEYTAGSPFYLQIMCDHLVRHLNRRRRPFVTEADVDQVSIELTTGASLLPVERFDPLITAAGESVAEASRDTYLQLLTGIAHASRPSGAARLEDIPAIENRTSLIKDLRERDVLLIDASGRYAIRVGLFAEWLRVNEPLQ